MATKVGRKGQVVIEKEIRERLGVEPGGLAIQQLVGDHVEIRFVPAPHRRSLRGALAKYIKRSIPEEEWDAAREAAWDAAVRERVDGWQSAEKEQEGVD